MSQKKASSDSGIQSVQRAAAILRCFTQTDSELGVTDLSKQLNLHKSTVSRLLSTLQQEGFVEQNSETGKYQLGLTLVTLAGIVLERLDLAHLAHPYLTVLAEQVQETVNLVVLSDRECMNIAGVASPRPIQYVGRIGRRTPIHCTAAGKVLAAYQPSTQRQRLLSGELLRFTNETIVDYQRLEQVLSQVRQQGYAVTHEEHQEGLSAVAAPICDHTGRVIATVVIAGPTYRFGPDETDFFIKAVQKTGYDISTQLGCVTIHGGMAAENRPG